MNTCGAWDSNPGPLVLRVASLPTQSHNTSDEVLGALLLFTYWAPLVLGGEPLVTGDDTNPFSPSWLEDLRTKRAFGA